MQGAEHGVELVAQVDLVPGDEEDADREPREDQEVQRPVDRDRAQDDLVAQRLAPERQLDLIAVGRMAGRRVLRRRERQPAVAAQAAMPPRPVHLAGEGCVLGPQLGRVETDERVALDPADEQLLVEARPEAARLGDAGQLIGSIVGGAQGPPI